MTEQITICGKRKPVMTDDVRYDFPGRFCEYEVWWEKRKQRICTAHLDEGRVFTCWCTSLKDAKTGNDVVCHKCTDARPPDAHAQKEQP